MNKPIEQEVPDLYTHYQGDNDGLGISRDHFRIPGLRGTVRLRSRKIDTPTNITSYMPEIAKEVSNRPWIMQLIEDAKAGKASAIFELTGGGLAITAALTAGFEFGIRGGRDIRVLGRLLRRFHKD